MIHSRTNGFALWYAILASVCSLTWPALAGSILTASIFLLPAPADAGLAETALERCHRVEVTNKTNRPAEIGYALALAEAALADDPQDARSHLSIFCALAKRVMHQSGVRLRVFSDLRRMRRHIDQALTINPDYADAVAAKGAYLYHLPRLLGGNAKVGLVMLERSLELDPANPATRLLFADVLADRGDHEESLRQSQKAAELLRSDNDQVQRAAACSVVDICADDRWSKEARLAVSDAC